MSAESVLLGADRCDIDDDVAVEERELHQRNRDRLVEQYDIDLVTSVEALAGRVLDLD